jgi:PAS domain S-box-containing protein
VANQNDEEALKSGALQNLQTMRIARGEAERALIETKETLKRRLHELAEQREWYRVVLCSIGDAVLTIDVNGIVTFMNPEAELLTGWSSSEAMGQPVESIFKVVNEKTREALPSRVTDVLQRGSSHMAPPRTAILIAKNGLEMRIEDATTPVKNSAEIIIGAVMVFRDLAERMDER